ncbi:MAG: SUF system NifU family Fe-S cluster assembly protein [Actinomycetota bacterium]|nr:MAG: SUF system NifU family Fe-S cluster assembly protein [Actinomycetota bacterium]
MPGLEDLYREIILDHYKNPRNEGIFPTPPAVKAEGHNPLCGDELTVYLLLEGDVIKDIRVTGQGCSISRSSASLMSVAVKGKTLEEVDHLLKIFKSMMSISTNSSGEAEVVEPVEYSERELGELIALQGVVKFPVRIKCATLSWNTLVQALESRAS